MEHTPRMDASGPLIERQDEQPGRGAAPAESVDRRFLLGSLAGVAGVAGIAAITSAARGGPLNPPVGPVTGTAKPLGEIEPRTAINTANTPGDAASVYIISQPGSYYLTGNVTVPAGKRAIFVSASNVAIDLCGFTIDGASAAGTGGIHATASLRGITVRNGNVINTANAAVSLGTTSAGAIENVTVPLSAGTGVQVGPRFRLRGVTVSDCSSGAAAPMNLRVGQWSTLVECGVFRSAGVGIEAINGNCVLVSCEAADNGGDGISVGSGSSLTGCVASVNGGVGIRTVGTCALTGCASLNNFNDGIRVGDQCTLYNCTSVINTGTGIWADTNCVFTGCTASYNRGTAGIRTHAGATLSDCSASNNTTGGAGSATDGFSIGSGSALFNCTANDNQNAGFTSNGLGGSPGSIFERCVARHNAAAGIQVEANSVVRGCLANANLMGVRAMASNCVLDGNTTLGNTQYGVYLEDAAAGSVVVRNVSSDNAVNFRTALNTPSGAFVNRVGLSVSGMSGNGPVASTIASEDPFANIAF